MAQKQKRLSVVAFFPQTSETSSRNLCPLQRTPDEGNGGTTLSAVCRLHCSYRFVCWRISPLTTTLPEDVQSTLCLDTPSGFFATTGGELEVHLLLERCPDTGLPDFSVGKGAPLSVQLRPGPT